MARDLKSMDSRMRARLSQDVIRSAVAGVPDEWLGDDAAALRDAYVWYLFRRVDSERGWLEEAEDARRRV